jgi:hypothetical protein
VGTATILFRGTAREFPFVKVAEARGRRAKRVVPAAFPQSSPRAAQPDYYLGVPIPSSNSSASICLISLDLLVDFLQRDKGYR